MRADLPFLWNVLVYFRPIFDRQFRKVLLAMLQQCDEDCIVIGGSSTHFKILGCAIDLVDGVKCKYKRKR